MKNKIGFRKKFRYWFDRLMGKGTVTLVAMLFLVTAIVVIVTGLIGNIFNTELSAGSSVWMSLMHAIDAGTLAGDSMASIAYLIVMSVVTLCGIFVTSILIGIISSGFEEKLNSLRKGFSVVIEENHTVILGFNDGIYTLLSELIEANANQKRGCILVVGDMEKEVMDAEIQSHIDDFKTTEIICRSGRVTDLTILEMVSMETARSVIVNQETDFQVIKTLLASTAYLKQKGAFERGIHIVALIHKKENIEAAKIAGDGIAEVLFLTDLQARIMAHTCRQPGMSRVLTEFFDFDGDEFYLESFPQLEGKQFGDVLNLFSKSVVCGIDREGTCMLNPPMDTVLQKTDKIIHLAEDDGASQPTGSDVPLQMELENQVDIPSAPYHLLIFGYNESLPIILNELDQFVAAGSSVTVACCAWEKDMEQYLKISNLSFHVKECNIYSKAVLQDLLSDGVHDIMLLSDQNHSEDDVDSKSMLILLQLRDIASKLGLNLNITSEMQSVENQRLCTVANVNDFVVGSSIASLIMTQVSENRALVPLFEDLLDADGSELYMKPAISYVKEDVPVNMYTLTEIAKKRHEIFIGYKVQGDSGIEIVTNPEKSQSHAFTKADSLIVLAED